jgi:exoribonuclease II
MRKQNRVDLTEMARQGMREKYLEPDFSEEVLEQAAALTQAADAPDVRDLRAWNWLSIDLETSQDLDQLSVGEEQNDGRVRMYIAIADVDALVQRDTPLDLHARYNTTSVYTVTHTFPMLPERLSHDLTSLRQDADRLAVVVGFTVTLEGETEAHDIFRACVRNKAKLTYDAVAAWLEERGAMPEILSRMPDVAEQVRLQDRAARSLRVRRQQRGTLELQTLQPQAVIRHGVVSDLRDAPQNRAEELIEDLMIAANAVTAQFLEQHGFPSLRRVVRTPQAWNSLVRISSGSLPAEPDSQALADFLHRQREADPVAFPDLSLLVVKLLGAGEYVLHSPGTPPVGHFGLAIRDYTHSTAPNRRYPDLITQRLLKAILEKRPCPYSDEELAELGEHCTFKEDMADRVERNILRSAAAMLLSRRVGDWFKGIITSVTPRGVYVRILRPPVEGMIGSRRRNVETGDRVSVRLAGVDIERGYLDFVL